METTELVQSASFEQQFSNKKTLHFKEGRIDVVDIAPENLRDETPILLVPGWSETPQTYKTALKIIANEGRRVITVGYSRTGGKVEKDEEVPQAEARKSLLLSQVIEAKNLDQVDMLACSEGATNGLIVASAYPERIRNVVLFTPAGLTEKSNVAMLMARFMKLMVKEWPQVLASPRKHSHYFTTAFETAKYIAKNPVRTLQEASAISSSDIHKMMQDLQRQGVMMSVIAAVDDPLFAVNKIIEEFRRDKEKSGQLPALEGFYSIKGSHNDRTTHPEILMPFALDALNGLQRKREIHQETSSDN